MREHPADFNLLIPTRLIHLNQVSDALTYRQDGIASNTCQQNESCALRKRLLKTKTRISCAPNLHLLAVNADL